MPFVILAGCVVPPTAAGAYPSAAGGTTAAAPAAGATCAETIVCYGACEPVTDACIAQCETTAAPGVPAQGRAVVTCMASTGCDTIECLQAQCPAEYEACFSGAGAQVAANPGGGGSGTTTAPVRDGFEHTTVTFDDGWTSTVLADRVLVERGGVRVHLFYALPYNASDFSGTGRTARDHYWDSIVAREHAVEQKLYRDAGAMGMPPHYIEGWATDRASGQRRFLAMDLSFEPNFALVTLVSAPDDGTVFTLFPPDANAFHPGIPTISAMQRFNRFPLGARDVDGTWQEGGGGTTSWYDAHTGAYVGATGVATSDVFTFSPDGSYTSVHNGATGRVGGMNTYQQAYRGTFEAARWQLVATERFQGATQTFAAHLVAVRGGRLLALDDGRGSRYTLVRTGR